MASYQREVRFLAQYFPDIPLSEMQQCHIEDYMLYIKVSLGCGRDKCRMAAQSFSFLWKHVFRKPFVLPSKLYPRKAFKLPNIMSVVEMAMLLTACRSLKQLALVSLYYSTGVRLEESSKLKIADVDSANMCIHVRGGKGNKDRKMLFTVSAVSSVSLALAKAGDAAVRITSNQTAKYQSHPQPTLLETLLRQ